jgi:hypothetical protein
MIKKGDLSVSEAFILETVLNESQMICYYTPSQEMKYHGIRNYVDFVLSQNKIDYYFTSAIRNTPYISDAALDILLE